jgi:D-alanine transaminase
MDPSGARPRERVVDIVYLNGEFLPKSEARLSVDDRGFLFADGLYEVTPAYRGTFFRMDRHLDRLRMGLCALRIEWDGAQVRDFHRELLERNGLADEEMSIVYMQVTRGAAPRSHAFPSPAVPPTVYAYAKVFRRPSRERWSEGYAAITYPDQRWSRCDLKTVGLLPCVLAQQAAVDAGAHDALLVRDGMALEGAHANLFVGFGETLVTHPASNQILHGITREVVLQEARRLGIPVEERPIPLQQLAHATEVFFTGTTTEVRPTVTLDGRPVGDGKVGPLARRLLGAIEERVLAETGAAL